VGRDDRGAIPLAEALNGQSTERVDSVRLPLMAAYGIELTPEASVARLRELFGPPEGL
jgi:hypothetical protein